MSLFSDLWTQLGCEVLFVDSVDDRYFVAFSGKPCSVFELDNGTLYSFSEFHHHDISKAIIREHIEEVIEESHG